MTQSAALSGVPGDPAVDGRPVAFSSYADDQPLEVSFDPVRSSIGVAGGGTRSVWGVERQGGALGLTWAGSRSEGPRESHLLAALEVAFAVAPGHAALRLVCPLTESTALVRAGLIGIAPDLGHVVAREALWQLPRPWLAEARAPYALRYTVTRGQRHPVRPPKPEGVVYRRHIPWLATSLTFRALDLERDLASFHRWMNDPTVAYFWQEEGDLAKQRAYLESIAADPRVTALIGCIGEEPFGYFEVYWAKEDRIAPFYDAHDFDRGWHALVGEPRFRGKACLTAWMPSISHYLFLEDCRTQRIVIEPRADNHKMIKSLARCGYALLKEFDFPHKRAMLGMLLRERFFGEALWIPRSPAHDAPFGLSTLRSH